MKGSSKIAIIGGGIGGMCAAIQLRKQHYEIDLVEINSTLTPVGAGITLILDSIIICYSYTMNSVIDV